MTLSPNATLYIALVLYAIGTLHAFAMLFHTDLTRQRTGLVAMVAGFISHTIWIGTICTLTGHPPLTNLAEAAGFVAWLVFAVELVLFLRYRVYAAAFFVHPLVLILLTISAVVHEPFTHVTDETRSRIFTAHILFSTVGVAALLIGLAFTYLAYLQDRSLRSKKRGRLWEWIPSLSVCRMVANRTLAIGFAIYTLGLLAGVVWSYRINAAPIELRIKQIGAVVAWVFFAMLLQSSVSGVFRGRRTVFVSACALIAVAVAMLGIHHG